MKTGLYSDMKKLLSVTFPILVAQLSTMGFNFINTTMAGHAGADDLAGVSVGTGIFFPFEGAAIEAGRLMLKRINELLAAKVSFSIETTLATRSYTRLIQRAQNAGYKVSLIYFWLNSPELAVNRVLQRVNEGGHNVPMDVIYRRYQAGINNLFQIYMPRVDYWLLADNSISPRVIVAEGYQHGEDRIYELELFKCIKNYVK